MMMEMKETELHNLCDYTFFLVVGKALSEAVITTQGGKHMPGLSNKKEIWFEDGRSHWKLL